MHSHCLASAIGWHLCARERGSLGRGRAASRAARRITASAARPRMGRALTASSTFTPMSSIASAVSTRPLALGACPSPAPGVRQARREAPRTVPAATRRCSAGHGRGRVGTRPLAQALSLGRTKRPIPTSQSDRRPRGVRAPGRAAGSSINASSRALGELARMARGSEPPDPQADTGGQGADRSCSRLQCGSVPGPSCHVHRGWRSTGAASECERQVNVLIKTQTSCPIRGIGEVVPGEIDAERGESSRPPLNSSIGRRASVCGDRWAGLRS